MAIFNSYVKLPEGSQHQSNLWIRFVNGPIIPFREHDDLTYTDAEMGHSWVIVNEM